MPPTSWIVLMSDQQNAWTCSDHANIRTPNLDRLKQTGTWFENAFCSSPICTPSRASCQTGLMPHQHKLIHNTGKDVAFVNEISRSIPTLADKLNNAGYATAYVGKWHIGNCDDPTAYGYQTYDKAVPCKTTPHPVVSEIHLPGDQSRRSLLARTLDMDPHDSEPMRVGHAAVDRLKKLINQSQPFLLFASTLAPHVPWQCPASIAAHYPPQDIPMPASYQCSLPESPTCYRRQYNMHNDAYLPDDWPTISKALSCYYGMCELVDQALGMILETLDQYDLTDQIGIIFLSDHGEIMGHHGRIGKGDYLFDPITRIPLLVAPPGGANVDRCDALVSICDVFATCLDQTLVLRDLPETSRSLLPLTQGKQTNTRQCLLLEHHGSIFHDTVRGIRTHDWKYVYRPNDTDELFDLNEDQYEQTNLINDPSHMNILMQLRHQLVDEMKQTNDPFTVAAQYSLLQNPINKGKK